MAKMLRGILGGLSGKVANVVGGSWKGVEYLRSLPLSVANPNTAGQQAQRGAFAQIVIVGKLLLASVLKPLNDRFAKKMSGFNRFIKMTIDAFATSGLTTPADFKISEGSLTAVTTITTESSAGNDAIEITWTDNSGTGTAVATDETYGVGHNVDTGEWVFTATPIDRSVGAISMALATNNTAGDVIHGWVAFRRADGTLASNTVHDAHTVT